MQSLLVVGDGDLVRELRFGPVARTPRVIDRSVDITGSGSLRKVMRELRQMWLQVCGVDAFQSFTGRLVKPDPLRDAQRLAERLAHQGM